MIRLGVAKKKKVSVEDLGGDIEPSGKASLPPPKLSETQQGGNDWTAAMFQRLQGADKMANIGAHIANFAGGVLAGSLAGLLWKVYRPWRQSLVKESRPRKML